MIGPDLFARVTAGAVVPEQVVPFVCAVGGSRPRMVGPCVGYETDRDFVIVGYPLHDPLDTGAMADAVNETLRIAGERRITLIGSARPVQAPEGSTVGEDDYYGIPVPPPAPGQKLRNLLRRAGRDATIERGRCCGEDHTALVERYMDSRPLPAGTRQIFRNLPRYLEASPGSRLFSARLSDGRLAAFAVGEFGALRTAFYMFSFRDPALAPPGSADLLLSDLLKEALERGQVYMNLGLGVSEGIGFFKRKWGASPFLPYVCTVWHPRRPGFISRLRQGAFSRRWRKAGGNITRVHEGNSL